MKALIKAIVVLFVLAVVLLVGGAYIIPPVARVERAVQVAAPPPMVFAIVSDLRRFPEWSPWQALDPGVAYGFEAAEQGVGQTMTWSSANPQVGKGKLSMVALEEDRMVVMEMDTGPMGKASSAFLLAPVETGTSVIWRFEKPVDGVLERWMSLMFDSAVGADHVRGLAHLKGLAETASPGT